MATAFVLTVTIALSVVSPAAPLQVKLKTLSWVSGPTSSLPCVSLLADQSPLARQVVASIEDQLSVVELPSVIVIGIAFRATVGAGSTVTVTERLIEPPAPSQLVLVFGIAPRSPRSSLAQKMRLHHFRWVRRTDSPEPGSRKCAVGKR